MSQNDILGSRDFRARSLVIGASCAPVEAIEDAPTPRPLELGDLREQEAWPPQGECDRLGLQALCETVEKVAVKREVIAAVANKNICARLQLFVDGIKAARRRRELSGMVAALDDELAAYAARGTIAQREARTRHTVGASART